MDTKTYGVKFYPEALRLCIHSSVATIIGNEGLSNDDFARLADHVEQSGSMFSKVGFVEAMLARDDLDVSLLERIAGIIDFFLEEPEDGRFGLLSNLFFFVSGRLSLSSSFDNSPVFARRLVEFSHASFLEEILISERVDAGTVAFDLAQQGARHAIASRNGGYALAVIQGLFHDPQFPSRRPAATPAAIGDDFNLRHKHVLKAILKPPWSSQGVRSKQGPVQN